jgi:hypothetical protein
MGVVPSIKTDANPPALFTNVAVHRPSSTPVASIIVIELIAIAAPALSLKTNGIVTSEPLVIDNGIVMCPCPSCPGLGRG